MESVPAPPTVTGLLLDRAGDPQPGLCFEDRRWSWREHVSECARYAAALCARRVPGRPFHVGVLADNVPEFSFLLGGCALAGAVLVALNPVRRGAALARDAVRTGCQYVLAEPRYAERFGCHVIDGFGSTEGGVAVSRTPDTPPGALGRLTDGVAILDPETGRPCPPARFGPGGELLNPAQAVGEIVNTAGPGLFAGYYDDAAADASRMRDGMYWSGDLGYADARGFCWFAGRAGQWLRVDGENLGTAPIERALLRHPAIAEAAVYGVPDPLSGDQVMACIVVRGGASLTPAEFGEFLAWQGDLGPRQHPRFVPCRTTCRTRWASCTCTTGSSWSGTPSSTASRITHSSASSRVASERPPNLPMRAIP